MASLTSLRFESSF